MNAFLMMSAAWMSGGDPVAVHAPAAAPVAYGASCDSGCGAPSCGSSCGSKASLFDKIRARFARSSSCCETAPSCGCDHAPKCQPECGTPLFTSQKASCDTCDTCGSKASFFDKIRARFARDKGCCEAVPACGGCAATAPAGCALPPAPNAAPMAPPSAAPQIMPRPETVPSTPKKSTSLFVPPAVTPASSNAAPAFVVPAIPMPAPAPVPVIGNGKSPF